MTRSKFHNVSTADLKAMFRDYLGAIADNMVPACEALVELKDRGERMRCMNEGLFRWHEEIANGRLSARAVLLNCTDKIIRRLIDLPLDQQEAIANGNEIEVAEIDNAGRIVKEKRRVGQLDDAALNRALPGAGVVKTYRQQAAALRREIVPETIRQPKAPPARVRAEDGFIIVGRSKVTVGELKPALEALGWRLSWVGVNVRDAS